MHFDTPSFNAVKPRHVGAGIARPDASTLMFSGRQTLPLRLFGQSVDSVDRKPDGFKSGTNPCLSRKKHYLCRNPLFIINYSLPT